jgi:hypothetical protein
MKMNRRGFVVWLGVLLSTAAAGLGFSQCKPQDTSQWYETVLDAQDSPGTNYYISQGQALPSAPPPEWSDMVGGASTWEEWKLKWDALVGPDGFSDSSAGDGAVAASGSGDRVEPWDVPPDITPTNLPAPPAQ